MIRVRAIIPRLSYDDLVASSVIPDLCSVIPIYPTKRYPPFVYKSKDFAGFGVLMDYVVRAGLRINYPADLGIEPCGSDHPSLSTYSTTTNYNDIMTSSANLINSSFDKGDLQKYVGVSVNINKELSAKWNHFIYYLKGTIRYNMEFQYGVFEGHPDIVTDHAVLDIKNTVSFAKMSKESSLQVLAYFALMKHSGWDVKYVGFVLPMQRDIFLCDLTRWDYTSYLSLLSETANTIDILDGIVENLQQLLAIQYDDIQLNLSHHPHINVGTHIKKGSHILETLREYYQTSPGCPCQLFITQPKGGKRASNTEAQLIEANKFITETNLQVFVHTPYVINLCAPISDDNWQQRLLIEECKLSVLLGSKGTVVHCGAKLTQSEATALDNMESRIRAALPYCTSQCPLLLETPCKEGTEVCGNIEDLLLFFSRFSNDPRLALCVDTCHVFVAGYNPFDYIKMWNSYSPIPIALVHYNDSEGICGSHLDRHALPGSGHIGKSIMHNIARYCNDRNIPLVIE